MKKFTSFYILAALCLGISGQDNAIKLNPPALLLQRVNLSYERGITERTSLHVYGGIKIPSGMPWFANFFIDTDTFDFDVRVTGFSVGADYRIYKDKALFGRYFAPYLMMAHQGIKLDGVISDYDASMKIGIRNFGLGITLGKQKMYPSGFVIDIFSGLGIGFNNLSGTYKTSDPAANLNEIAAEIKDELMDIPIIGNKVEVTSSANEISISTRFITPMLRFGLLLGFAF